MERWRVAAVVDDAVLPPPTPMAKGALLTIVSIADALPRRDRVTRCDVEGELIIKFGVWMRESRKAGKFC